MAATEKACKVAQWKRFTVILGSGVVIGFVALYIWRKIYIIRKQKDGTQFGTDGGLLAAAYQHFNSILKLGNEKTDFSFLEKEFYIFLWELILLDIRNIISVLHYYLLLYLEINIFFIVTVIVILIVLLIRTFTQRYKKNQGSSRSSRTGRNKNERLKAPDSQDSIGFCCESHYCIERAKSRTKLYWWRLAVAILGVSMLLSVPWEFVRLYKMKVAEKVAVVQSGVPPECVPDQMSFQQVLHSWLQWLFSWDTDSCEKFHRSLLVDPVWEIPPLLICLLHNLEVPPMVELTQYFMKLQVDVVYTVVTTAFIHCILHPVELMFNGMGRAFRLFFKEIPTQWQPVMLLVLMILFILFLVMLFGYRIQFPFLLKLELSSRNKKQKYACKERIDHSQENSQESIQGSQ